MPSLKRLAGSTWAHVAFAVLAMGGWALFANRAHGLAAALAPALAQGAMSGLITLGLKRALEAMAGRFAGVLAFAGPPLITAGVILAVLAGVHLAIGTPEIWRTLAVPWTVSTLYAAIYTAALARGAARTRTA
jgi:hypothetical protein